MTPAELILFRRTRAERENQFRRDIVSLVVTVINCCGINLKEPIKIEDLLKSSNPEKTESAQEYGDFSDLDKYMSD